MESNDVCPILIMRRPAVAAWECRPAEDETDMKSILTVILSLVAAIVVPCAAAAAVPGGEERLAAVLAARCDSLTQSTTGEVIAVVVDDGRERLLIRDGAKEYAALFEALLDSDDGVVCDCRDDYDARICYAVLCCRAYRDGCVVSHIVMPLNENDATKGDITYPLERRITDSLLRLIAF